MPIAFVAEADVENTVASTTITISVPTGTVDGHIMLAFIAASNHKTFTDPTGWNLILDTSGGANDFQMRSYWRVASNEPASYTWTVDVTATLMGGIATYSGVNTSTPVDVSSGLSNSTATTSCNIPDVGALAEVNEFLVSSLAEAVGTSIVVPTGMTSRWIANPAAGDGSAGADELRSTTAAPGIRSWTWTFSSANVGQVVAIRPAHPFSDDPAVSPTRYGPPFIVALAMRSMGLLAQESVPLLSLAIADEPGFVAKQVYPAKYPPQVVAQNWTERIAALQLTPADEPGFTKPLVYPARYLIGGISLAIVGADEITFPLMPPDEFTVRKTNPPAPISMQARSNAVADSDFPGAPTWLADEPGFVPKQLYPARYPPQIVAQNWTERIAAFFSTPADEPGFSKPRLLRAVYPPQIAGQNWTERIAALPLTPIDDSPVARWSLLRAPLAQWTGTMQVERIAALPFGGTDDEPTTALASAISLTRNAFLRAQTVARSATQSSYSWVDRIAAFPFGGTDEEPTIVLATAMAATRSALLRAFATSQRAIGARDSWVDRIAAPALAPADEPGFLKPRLFPAIYPPQIAAQNWTERVAIIPAIPPDDQLPARWIVLRSLLAQFGSMLQGERIAALPFGGTDDEPTLVLMAAYTAFRRALQRAQSSAQGSLTASYSWIDRIGSAPFGGIDDEPMAALLAAASAVRTSLRQSLAITQVARTSNLLWIDRLAALPLVPADESKFIVPIYPMLLTPTAWRPWLVLGAVESFPGALPTSDDALMRARAPRFLLPGLWPEIGAIPPIPILSPPGDPEIARRWPQIPSSRYLAAWMWGASLEWRGIGPTPNIILLLKDALLASTVVGELLVRTSAIIEASLGSKLVFEKITVTTAGVETVMSPSLFVERFIH